MQASEFGGGGRERGNGVGKGVWERREERPGLDQETFTIVSLHMLHPLAVPAVLVWLSPHGAHHVPSLASGSEIYLQILHIHHHVLTQLSPCSLRRGRGRHRLARGLLEPHRGLKHLIPQELVLLLQLRDPHVRFLQVIQHLHVRPDAALLPPPLLL